MKNLIRLTLFSAGIALSTTGTAQESIKNTAATTSTQMEAPKATPQDNKTAPQDSKAAPKTGTQTGKTDPQSGTTKKDATKSDTTQAPSGTRMAITEQGVPKKKKTAAASTTTGTTPPAKKKDGN